MNNSDLSDDDGDRDLDGDLNLHCQWSDHLYLIALDAEIMNIETNEVLNQHLVIVPE